MNSVPEEVDYYARRAETQLELAQRTDNPVVVAAHCAIANSYLELDVAQGDEEGAIAA